MSVSVGVCVCVCVCFNKLENSIHELCYRNANGESAHENMLMHKCIRNEHALCVCMFACLYVHVCMHLQTYKQCMLVAYTTLTQRLCAPFVCVCVCLRVSGKKRSLTARQSCACWRLLPYATSRGNHIIGYLAHIHARTTPRTNLTDPRAYANTLTPRTRKNTHVRAHE